MKLLAIDTTTDACSVAISAGGALHAEQLVEARAHTRELLPMIRRQLAAAGLSITQLDAIVLGNGPGSFIGLRIGASVAQGVAFAAGLKIVPVSSLAAVAAEAFAADSESEVVVAQDARMGEIYLAVYRRDDDGLPRLVGETRLLSVDAFDPADASAVAGGAWSKHPTLSAALPKSARNLGIALPDARYLLETGRRDWLAGRAIEPADLEPGYIRQTVAAVPGGQA